MPIFETKEVRIDKHGDPKNVFRIPTHLELVKKVGSGAYGRVAAFKDSLTGKLCAVKKITAAFDDLQDGKRILREVKLLRHFDHENIIRVFDMYPPESPDFEDIYIVTDLMDTDLHTVIYSRLKLEQDHYRFFGYQILRGLAYLHAADILHRDLKPQNLLVNNNCDLKICDFGLARVLNCEEGDTFGQTDYVVTRWYRAPEVVLLASGYTKAIDIWSVGCILCEMILRKPLFNGKDYRDQIKQILAVLGTPSEEELQWLPEGGEGRRYLKKFDFVEKVSWEQALPQVSEQTRDAVQAMLHFDPGARIIVQEAMRLPYFENLYKMEDAEVVLAKIDWSFDDFRPTRSLLQKYIYDECASFHPEILERDRSFWERVRNEESATPITYASAAAPPHAMSLSAGGNHGTLKAPSAAEMAATLPIHCGDSTPHGDF